MPGFRQSASLFDWLLLKRIVWHFDLSKTKTSNIDFRTGKPVNTAPDWTGHVTVREFQSETRIVCEQGNKDFYSLRGKRSGKAIN